VEPPAALSAPSCRNSTSLPPCVVPPVFPTPGVPQGAYFVREWGALAFAGDKKPPGLRVSATRGVFATRLPSSYAMASMIALKVPLDRIAFDVLTGSGS